jgi:vacuole morphology and inheritance protein 14
MLVLRGFVLPALRSLYGILMLLPQSTAFTSLKTRLESVAPLVLLIKGCNEAEQKKSGSSSSAAASSKSSLSSSTPAVGSGEPLPLSELLAHFESIQAKHAQRKRRMQKSASLIKKP